MLAHRPPQEASDRLTRSRVCTKSAKSASGTLGAYFVLSKWYSNADLMQKKTYLLHTLCILCINFMHTICRLCENCDLGGDYPPKSLLHLTNSQGAACLPQRVKSQLAWFGARWAPSATAGFGAGGACDPPNPQNDGSIGRSWGTAKGAARSPRCMESQLAWSGGGGTTSVTSGFCR